MSEAYLYFSRENYRCSSYINYVLDIDVVPIYMLDIDVSSSYWDSPLMYLVQHG